MRRHLVLLALFLPAAPGVAPGQTSWIFAPSYFSHDAATGQRVTQYAPPQTAYYRSDPTYLQSGYRHDHIRIPAGDSSDNYHIVETWGAGEFIRPYGEWLRPFRAGATPFGPWGNPQGPWTLPFGAWSNPYGLGRLTDGGWGNGPANMGPMPYGPTPYGPHRPPRPPRPPAPGPRAGGLDREP